MKLPLLKKKLDGLQSTYNKEYLSSDPIWFVHRYRDPVDREVVGLICSSLAYGNVKMIQRNLERLLAILGTRPARYVRGFSPIDRSSFSGFTHRFNTADDIVLLLWYIQQMLEIGGSIGGFFNAGCRNGQDIRQSLSHFVERVLTLDCSPVHPDGILPDGAGVRFFFPSPAGGSACKRLNLYLRWMVRRDDGIDFGLWQFISPANLIIPLDTHVARICRLIGLTRRTCAGWPMAAEITENLKRLDPHDPVKYDFAISRLGILAECPKNPVAEKCFTCKIKSVCTNNGVVT
ncbi:MAG: TIGR02757 family protein [Candidatus Abyssobacteria bacterium SURF_5]|uniref:TIGR02757 family protein n=1 Tax=Abyssobacteria bacterium (strain SURF_5) TaxID=2093360 RepID=A0A3A4P8E4_ABYX5|nr:MAG: TIGR02757 family protein [Candidatus Abyssubacteria bacterium SURF_5]